MGKLLSKSEMIEKIAAEHSELSKKQVKGVIESLATVGYKELKKNSAFVVPGFAKFVVKRSLLPRSEKASTRSQKSPRCLRPSPPERSFGRAP